MISPYRSSFRSFLACLGAGGLLMVSAQAEDVLWKLDFDGLGEKAALEPAPYAPDSGTPQRVGSDSDNTLTGAKKFGDLNKSPLVFKKGSTEKYLPNFELISTEAWSSGIVTIEWEFVIDDFDLKAVNAQGLELDMETLLTFSVYTTPGLSKYRITVLGKRDSQVALNGEGLTDATHDRGPKALPFSLGEIMKVKIVLNLSEKTLQVFANDEPFSEVLQDEKFGEFSGFRVGDGTAVGGNYGSTFTAAIDNINITHQ